MVLAFSLPRAKAHTLVDSLSELMVDASLGTIQCLEEIVSALSKFPLEELKCFLAKLELTTTMHRILDVFDVCLQPGI